MKVYLLFLFLICLAGNSSAVPGSNTNYNNEEAASSKSSKQRVFSKDLEIKYKYGMEFLKKKDVENAILWFTDAANKHHINSQYELSKIYFYNIKKPILAYKWGITYLVHGGKKKVPINYLVKWLSLGEIDDVHSEILAWLKGNNVQGAVVKKVQIALKRFTNKIEEEDVVGSTIETQEIDRFFMPFMMGVMTP